MLPVTNDYLTDMAKLIRNYSDVFITISVGSQPTTIYSSDSFGGNGEAPRADNFDPQSTVSSGYFETSQADSDGEFVTAPYFGFMLSTASDFQGVSLQFSNDPDYYVYGLQVAIYHSDLTHDDYDFDIDCASLPGGVFTIPNGFEDVKYIYFLVTKVNPDGYGRILNSSMHTIFGFDNKVVSNIETQTEIDQISRRLPTETISFRVLDYNGVYDPDNPGGIWKYFEEKQPLTIQYGYLLDDGTWEWLDKTSYVLTGSPTKSGFDVTFDGTKLLATLTGTYRKGIYDSNGVTLYALARAVLQDAGISVVSGLDVALANITVTAPLPIATHAECLQLIAQAGNCLLYTGSDGKIHLKSGWYPSSLLGNETINYDTQLDFPVIDITPPLKTETVKQYRYVPVLSVETLVDQTMDVIGTVDIWIDYDLSTGQSATVTGGTLNSATYYGRCALLNITGSGTLTVQITGQRVMVYSSSTDYEIGSTGDVDTFDNELITGSVLQYEVAQYRANYLKNRNAYTLKYRGNPELECSDVVGFETEYADNLVGVIASTKITYNGALGGELILKKMDSYLDYYYADSELYSGENVGVM